MLKSGELAKKSALRRLLNDFGVFSRVCYPERMLREYQLEAALPVLEAVERGKGWWVHGYLFAAWYRRGG